MVAAAAVFGAVLTFQSANGWCYRYPEELPMALGYFSWWPFGAGCDFYTDPDQQPGPLWTVALVAIAASGVALCIATRKSGGERQLAESSP